VVGAVEGESSRWRSASLIELPGVAAPSRAKPEPAAKAEEPPAKADKPAKPEAPTASREGVEEQPPVAKEPAPA